MKDRLTRKVLGKGDAFIVHSKQDAEDLRRLVRDPVFIHGVHPTYNQFRKKFITREEARAALKVPEGQEMLIIVTELTKGYYSASFISRYGCEEYFKHNKELLFYERQNDITKEIMELDL